MRKRYIVVGTALAVVFMTVLAPAATLAATGRVFGSAKLTEDLLGLASRGSVLPRLLRLPGATRAVEVLFDAALGDAPVHLPRERNDATRGVDRTRRAAETALIALEQRADGHVEITWNPRTGTASFVRGTLSLTQLGLTATAGPSSRGLAFLGEYSRLFGIGQPADELDPVRTVVDALGQSHVTLQQVYQGVEVHSAVVKVHLSRDGEEVLAVTSGFVPGISLTGTVPQITSEEALITARKALPRGVAPLPPELVVYAPATIENPGGSAALAWRVELRDDSVPARNVYIVDASNGWILDVLERLPTTILPVGVSRRNTAVDQASSAGSYPVEVVRSAPSASSTHKVIFVQGIHSGTSFAEMRQRVSWLQNIMLLNPLLTEDLHAEDFHFFQYAPDRDDELTEGEEYFNFDTCWSIDNQARDGSAILGTAKRLEDLVGRLKKENPELQTVSILAHSMGGVLATYAAPALAAIVPRVNIVTFDSPLQGLSDAESAVIDVLGDNCLVLRNDPDVGNPGYDSPIDMRSDSQVIRTIVSREQTNGIRLFTIDAEPGKMDFAGAPIVPFGVDPATVAWADKHIDIAAESHTGIWEGELANDAQYVLLDGFLAGALSGRDPPLPHRETNDAGHGYRLPGALARVEQSRPTGDRDVDNAHDFAGETYAYFYDTQNRDSYDDRGATLVSSAHYGQSYLNAFWNGQQIVYGDGFAVQDVATHEITHAVTEHTANLEYEWQSGALNESFSDIFAAMVDGDDWLIGEDLPPHVLAGRPAIRDMANPTRLGQPEHARDWVETCSDQQGVHANSGITNKASYNIATAVGRDTTGRIFYRALAVYLQPNSSLEDSRAAALQSAEDLYGRDTPEYAAVREGFNAVGIDGRWQPSTNDCTCASVTALAGEADRGSAVDVLTTLYQVRDQLMGTTVAGRYYRRLYEDNTGRISYLLLRDPALRATGVGVLKRFTPGLQRLANGEGDQALISQQMILDVASFLQELADVDRAHGGGGLAGTIEQELDRLNLNEQGEMTFDEAWAYINARAGSPAPSSDAQGPFAPQRIAGDSGFGDERDVDLYPAISYDAATDRYLAVWMTARNADSRSDGLDVYGRFLDGNGQPLGSEFRISDRNSGARNAIPAVAAGDGAFVVAWTVRGSSCQVRVQRVTDGSNHPDRLLGSGPGHRHSPSLVYNPERQRYVLAYVVGDDYMSPTFLGAETADCGANAVSGSHISAVEFHFSGDIPVEDAAVMVSGEGVGAFRPKLAYSPGLGEYLVAWEDRREAGGEPYRFDLYVRRLGGDIAVASEETPLATGGTYRNYDASATWTPRPSVAGGSRRFLVTWFAQKEYERAVVWSTMGRLIPSDEAEAVPFTIARMPFGSSHTQNAPTGSLAAAYVRSGQGYLLGTATHLESLWGYFSFALVQRVGEAGLLVALDGSPQNAPGVGISADYENDDQRSVAMAVKPKGEASTAHAMLLYAKHALNSAPKDFDIWRATVPLATTDLSSVPGVPTNVWATAGDGKATVTWDTPADDGGSPVLYYTVAVIPGSGGTSTTATTTATSTVVTGLTNGVTYTFTVVAVNAVGAGAPSAPSNAVAPAGAPSVTVSGTLTLQGVSSTSSVAGIGPTVALTPQIGGPTATSTVSPDGSYEFPGVVLWTYTLTASADGFLSRRRSDLVVAGGVSLQPVELRAGLVDGNAAVNIHDITAVIASFGSSPSDRLDASGRVVDLNADGVVDLTDISLAVSNFGATSPQPWP